MGRGWEREGMGWEGVEELRYKKGGRKVGKRFCPPSFKEFPPPTYQKVS